MKSSKTNAILGIIFCLFYIEGLAQEKFEKESRISEEEIPAIAKSFIKEIQSEKKVRWYMEQSQSGTSIEAKFTSARKDYSIEFDSLGSIEDIEIIIDWNEIAEGVTQNIRQEMNSKFEKWKIRKIQIQYTGDREVLLELGKNKKPTEDYVIKYEIVVKGKKEGRPKLFEMTFSEQGEFLKSSTIIFKNTDILEY